jgi:hypothetical protein
MALFALSAPDQAPDRSPPASLSLPFQAAAESTVCTGHLASTALSTAG